MPVRIGVQFTKHSGRSQLPDLAMPSAGPCQLVDRRISPDWVRSSVQIPASPVPPLFRHCDVLMVRDEGSRVEQRLPVRKVDGADSSRAVPFPIAAHVVHDDVKASRAIGTSSSTNPGSLLCRPTDCADSAGDAAVRQGFSLKEAPPPVEPFIMEIVSTTPVNLTFPHRRGCSGLTASNPLEIAKIPGADTAVLRELHRITRSHRKERRRSPRYRRAKLRKATLGLL